MISCLCAPFMAQRYQPLGDAGSYVINSHCEAALLTPTKPHHLTIVNLNAHSVSGSWLAFSSAVVASSALTVRDHSIGKNAVTGTGSAIVPSKWVVRQARRLPSERRDHGRSPNLIAASQRSANSIRSVMVISGCFADDADFVARAVLTAYLAAQCVEFAIAGLDLARAVRIAGPPKLVSRGVG